MDKSIERGLDHIESICDYLNTLIVSTNREIDRNDKTLWGEYLHKWKNSDWEDVLNAYEYVLDKTGYHPSEQEHRAWEQARWNLGAYSKLLKIDKQNAPGYGETPQNTLFLDKRN